MGLAANDKKGMNIAASEEWRGSTKQIDQLGLTNVFKSGRPKEAEMAIGRFCRSQPSTAQIEGSS